jgi:hypothetical protein
MVYQHFTLVPAMTVAENLVLAKPFARGRRLAGETKRWKRFSAYAVPGATCRIGNLGWRAAEMRDPKQLYLRRRF